MEDFGVRLGLLNIYMLMQILDRIIQVRLSKTGQIDDIWCQEVKESIFIFLLMDIVLQILVFLTAPEDVSTGFIFVRIRGGFHEIRNSVCMLFVDYCCPVS